MSVRVVFVKDPHFRFGFKRPVGRTDSFFRDIRAKVDYLVDFCKKRDIFTVCVAGDLLDRGKPSDYTLPVLRSVSSVLSRFKEEGIDLVVIQGNHDMPTGGFNTEDYGNSVITYLANQGLLVDVSSRSVSFNECGFSPHKVSFESDCDFSVYVSGIGYCASDVDFRSNVEIYNKHLLDFRQSLVLDDPIFITLLHQHVLPDGVDFPWEFSYSYSEIAKMFPYSNIIFAGHNHKGFGDNFYHEYVCEDGRKVYFISPTAFTRLARDKSILDGNEDPVVTVAEFDCNIHGNVMSVESYPIECRSACDVFVVDEFEVETRFKSDLTEFNAMVRSFRTGSQVDSIEVPDKVKDLVSDYLNRADDLLG